MGQLRGRLYWYVFGTIGGQNGKPPKTVGLGGYRTENEARTAANNVNDWADEYQVCSYRTVQLSVAKSCYRAERTQKTGNLGISLMPIRSANNKKASRFEQIKQSRGIE